jgi:hypothetical protein
MDVFDDDDDFAALRVLALQILILLSWHQEIHKSSCPQNKSSLVLPFDS